MTSNSSLLKLLQLCDSSFPLGAYSHSWGLETWTQLDKLKNVHEVEQAIDSLLRLSIAPKEGVAVRLAHQYGTANDKNNFARLNVTLSASNWAQETQNASLAMGDRLKILANKLGWLNDVPHGQMHHCAVFGWLSALLHVDANSAVAAYLSTSVGSLVSAAVKLVPLGHTDGQRIIAHLASTIEAEAKSVSEQLNPRISSFAPLQEWASFEHERLYSRLFQS